VIYSEAGDVMLLTVRAAPSRTAVLHTTAVEHSGVVSPDGRWIAYDSSDSGFVSPSTQVFVRPFPDVNKARFQISTDGGGQPRWSRDGRELYARLETSKNIEVYGRRRRGRWRRLSR
jgi:serine/threonine-protein kinase